MSDGAERNARFAARVLGGTAAVTSIVLAAVLVWLTNGFSGEPVPTPLALVVLIGWTVATAIPAILVPRSLRRPSGYSAGAGAASTAA
jgi:hypothetical protein